MTGYDVYGVGHALVDLQFSVDERQLAELGVEKGVMTLIDLERRQAILDGLPGEPVRKASGGSAANTVMTVARFGGTASYAYQVGDDDWGQFYHQDLLAAGVVSDPAARQCGVTGQCLVLVTPDADRSMCTFLGASAAMGPHQVDRERARVSRFVYLEGYLLTTEDGFDACVAAARYARQGGAAVSLNLSDPVVVETFRARFEQIVDGVGVDVLFGNRSEAAAFTGRSDARTAIALLAKRVPRVFVTQGADGALVAGNDGGPAARHVPGFPARAVDTTGAGDTFAGGVLYGLTHGCTSGEAAVLGNYGAAVVVSAFGPRLAAPLGHLVEAILNRCAPAPASLTVDS